MPILRSLQPVSLELKKFSIKYPELFFKVRRYIFNIIATKQANFQDNCPIMLSDLF